MLPLTAADIERLSVDERLALIEALWDSLDAQTLPVSEDLRAELDRRLAEHDANPQSAVPWETVGRKLLGGA